jgi:hypothetical protein
MKGKVVREVRDALFGEEKGIIFLEGSQALPTCPSDRSSIIVLYLKILHLCFTEFF